MSASPLRLRARHYATGERLDLLCEHGRIATMTPAGDGPVDLEAGWTAPALFDLQINGCDGISFNSPHLSADDIRRDVGVCRRHGIGALSMSLIHI
jgi:N-acetylglucosamine-6-phosphate deacetylase